MEKQSSRLKCTILHEYPFLLMKTKSQFYFSINRAIYSIAVKQQPVLVAVHFQDKAQVGFISVKLKSMK